MKECSMNAALLFSFLQAICSGMQVTDELALLDQLLRSATSCAKHHDAAGLAEVLRQLDQLSGSQVSAGKSAHVAKVFARQSLQHIAVLTEGRRAAMKGQRAVLRNLAKTAEMCGASNEQLCHLHETRKSARNTGHVLQTKDGPACHCSIEHACNQTKAY
jgi:hypothetical protein